MVGPTIHYTFTCLVIFVQSAFSMSEFSSILMSSKYHTSPAFTKQVICNSFCVFSFSMTVFRFSCAITLHLHQLKKIVIPEGFALQVIVIVVSGILLDQVHEPRS